MYIDWDFMIVNCFKGFNRVFYFYNYVKVEIVVLMKRWLLVSKLDI